jgi:hypothetical protein
LTKIFEVLEKGKNIRRGVRAVSGSVRSAIKYSRERYTKNGVEDCRGMEDETVMEIRVGSFFLVGYTRTVSAFIRGLGVRWKKRPFLG